ncbi:hypothetical protein NHQ30_000730 [Ciborinia camelliae]|nr:hypothetical protein NHQ30_000730 [Ciborinia camelliae]
MPRSVRMATIKATKSKPPTKKKNIVKTNKKASQPEPTEFSVTNPLDRIYTTFTIENGNMKDGLWMMRKLDNGKYEAVNLSTVAYEDICSEENEKRLASTPESVQIFKASQKSLVDVTAKLDRAVFTASGKVFRFNKLPIELRYKIYEFALILDTGSALYCERSGGYRQPDLAFGLLATSRSINAECAQFLWKNSFNLSAPSMKCLKNNKECLIRNVRHVKFTWTGSHTTDLFILGMIASSPNLETLYVKLGSTCVEKGPNSYPHYVRRPQYLHQGDNSIRKFSRTNGFDKLISLRGLKKVIVSKHWGLEAAIRVGTLTEADVKAFEKFLMEKLTTPVAPPMVLLPLPSTPTRKSTRIQKLNGDKPIKYVPDPVSDDEEDFGSEDADKLDEEVDEDIM